MKMNREHCHASLPFAQPGRNVPVSVAITDTGIHNGHAQTAPLCEAQKMAALRSLKEELANLSHHKKAPLVNA